MKSRILVISSVESDLCLNISKLPREGESTCEGGRREYKTGGRGAISAITFARLGADSMFCGKIGSDADGARLKQSFAKHGIDTRFMSIVRDGETGFAVIINESGAVRRRIYFPGACNALTSDDIEEAFTAYPDAVFLQLEVPERAAAAALRFGAAQRIPIIVDASPHDGSYPLERFADITEIEIFLINEKQVYALTGIKPTGVDSCLRAVVKLAAIVRAKYFVLKIGDRGAFLYDNKYYKIIPTYECEVIDTSAAGDVFSAALTLSYLRGRDITASIKYANAVATIVVSRAGEAESIPSAAEVTRFIADLAAAE